MSTSGGRYDLRPRSEQEASEDGERPGSETLLAEGVVEAVHPAEAGHGTTMETSEPMMALRRRVERTP